MWEVAFSAAAVLLLLGIVAAAAFEQGRVHFKKEIEDSWRKAMCRECGAIPQARLIHVSGCESGWPDPADTFEKLKVPRG
jgi:hypothetical protein